MFARFSIVLYHLKFVLTGVYILMVIIIVLVHIKCSIRQNILEERLLKVVT